MKATMAWRCRACDDLVKDYLCVPCLDEILCPEISALNLQVILIEMVFRRGKLALVALVQVDLGTRIKGWVWGEDVGLFYLSGSATSSETSTGKVVIKLAHLYGNSS
ncbi:hypothetical protein Tco_0320045 [Tanacetum coccineum]